MASGVPGDLPFQVILAGRHGVGKSYIFERLQKEADQYGSGLHTVDTGTGRSAASGRDKWMVHTTCGGGRNATVVVWDTGGMEREGVRNMSSGYFNKAHAVILVYDTGDMHSLTELQGWMEQVQEHCQYRKVVVALWGHDTGNSVNPMDSGAARQFAAARGISASLVCNVCATSGEGLVAGFKAVVDTVHTAARQPQQRADQDRVRVHKRGKVKGNRRSSRNTGQRQQQQSWKNKCCYN